jgi:hypothetical protein
MRLFLGKSLTTCSATSDGVVTTYNGLGGYLLISRRRQLFALDAGRATLIIPLFI